MSDITGKTIAIWIDNTPPITNDNNSYLRRILEFTPPDWTGTELDFLALPCNDSLKLHVALTLPIIGTKAMMLFMLWCARQLYWLRDKQDDMVTFAINAAEQYIDGRMAHWDYMVIVNRAFAPAGSPSAINLAPYDSNCNNAFRSIGTILSKISKPKEPHHAWAAYASSLVTETFAAFAGANATDERAGAYRRAKAKAEADQIAQLRAIEVQLYKDWYGKEPTEANK